MFKLVRRLVLVAVHLSPLLLVQASVLPPAVDILGLHAIAALRGKYVGTASDLININNDTAFGHGYKELALSDNFGFFTPENSCKWINTEPEPGVFNFTACEGLLEVAERTGKRFRGHNLVWHNQLPDWVTSGNFTNAELTAVLKRHVITQASHFKGRVFAWDVVNEPFNEDGTLSATIWFNGVGPNYIAMALQWAHEADPNAHLYINDFNLESVGPKSNGARSLVTSLKKQGVPITGIGIESHLIIGEVPTDFQTNLQMFTDTGVEVALTELDIRGNLPVTDAQLTQQAADYKTSVDACLGVERCIGITVWEFTDRVSWVPGTFAGMGFADIFDQNNKIKPAYTAFKNALINDK